MIGISQPTGIWTPGGGTRPNYFSGLSLWSANPTFAREQFNQFMGNPPPSTAAVVPVPSPNNGPPMTPSGTWTPQQITFAVLLGVLSLMFLYWILKENDEAATRNEKRADLSYEALRKALEDHR